MNVACNFKLINYIIKHEVPITTMTWYANIFCRNVNLSKLPAVAPFAKNYTVTVFIVVSFKYIFTIYIGVPDRIVLLPGGHLGFVELKAPGQQPSPIQVRRIQQMRAMGFKVFVVDGVEQIGGVLDAIQTS